MSLISTLDLLCYYSSRKFPRCDTTLRRLKKYWKWGILIAFLTVALGTVVYLVHVGNTDSWPQAGCTLAGSRVVRDDVADSSRAIVMYRGEYQLHYVVGGREHYVWANSGWSDVDKQFVEAKVDSLAGTCDFRVRYNPRRPSEAIASRK